MTVALITLLIEKKDLKEKEENSSLSH